MSSEEVINGLVRDVMALKKETERLAKVSPLYQVLNQAPNFQNVTGTENNLALGNYDMITLNPTANRTINGITGGVMGRFLLIRNVSASFTLSFTHANASATDVNRIITVTGGTIVIGARQTAIFEYMVDSTLGGSSSNRWWLLIPFA